MTRAGVGQGCSGALAPAVTRPPPVEVKPAAYAPPTPGQQQLLPLEL
jgi:hypothetical protein